MRGPSLVRGFPEDERGEVREAVEALRRAGWLVHPINRKVHGEAFYALNPDFHREIERLVETGEVTNLPALTQWLEGEAG